MLLVADVGNTNTVYGIYNGDVLVRSFRTVTGDFSVKFSENINAAVISSVVPSVNQPLTDMIRSFYGCQVIQIDSTLNTGLTICTDYPEKVGADLICGAAAAFYKYRSAVIVFDLGTASTVCAVDGNGNYLGHSIFPGVKISFSALHNAAEQLPEINDGFSCSEVIGKNTVSSMRSGVILGAACFIDGMTVRYRNSMGEDAKVIVTGGLSEKIIPYCSEYVIFDENLVLDGMRIIYNKNNV